MSNYYFDMETTGLNPFADDAKILTAQFLDENGKFIIFKEWELGEKLLIEEVQNFFLRININLSTSRRTYNPVYTYNGKFDFHYYLSRVTQLFDRKECDIVFKSVILWTKHCDLIQYDNGYLLSLEKLVKKYRINRLTHFMGKDVKNLYEMGNYDDIVFHAKDDVYILKELVEKHDVGGNYR